MALVAGHPGAGTTPGLVWRQMFIAFATDGLGGTADRATFVARSADSGDPINAAYIDNNVPAYIGRLALSWDTADQPAGLDVELNLHDQSSMGTPVDMFDSSHRLGLQRPARRRPDRWRGFAHPQRGGARLPQHHERGRPGDRGVARPELQRHGAVPAGLRRGRERLRRRRQLPHTGAGAVPARHQPLHHLRPGAGPSLTPEAHQNLGLVFRITSGPDTGFTRGWRLADLVEGDDTEPYTWSLGTGRFWDAMIAGHRITGAFVDLSVGAGSVSLTGATFNPSDGSAAGPDFTNRDDLGLMVVAGGSRYLLPLDAIDDDDDEPYRWAATYDAGLVAALSGDVAVALVDRVVPQHEVDAGRHRHRAEPPVGGDVDRGGGRRDGAGRRRGLRVQRGAAAVDARGGRPALRHRADRQIRR